MFVLNVLISLIVKSALFSVNVPPSHSTVNIHISYRYSVDLKSK